MDFGIRKVLKEKKDKDKKIDMVELFGTNLFAILIFDENDNLIDSECNCTFEDPKKARKITNLHYRKKLKNLQNF